MSPTSGGALPPHEGGVLHLCLDDAPPGPDGQVDPALDTAIGRVLLDRVGRGELPPTLRLARPARVLAFSARDARAAGFAAAVTAARAADFAPVIRLAGGRPAVFTPATISFSWAVPDPDPHRAIGARFDRMAGVLRDALRSLGIEAGIGAVPGEYCPGAHSVHAAARTKLAGIGQRLTATAAHTGGVLVVDDVASINAVLGPVHRAMAIDWDPAATGSVRTSAGVDPATGWVEVRDAIVAAFATTHTLEPWSLDERTSDDAFALVQEHRVS
ncbi:MAG: lipoate--protein ligase family protein [Nitriliruptoraceae bacterium]|nr:lipoate--protein ligase family protein [Nitriliruptoraceae bacterium]